ncbi:helix-turn-helix transcriptional regulator [Luteococcus sp. H101]|uniref:helix-turn-helix transcriptional regulator n=1 Tax=Luteococcus sp. H101 TaxID=3139402 RepID=UPI00313C5CA4
MGPSTILPSRQRVLERLRDAARPGQGSRLVVVDVVPGSRTDLLRDALPGCRELVGLSWQQPDPLALLRPLIGPSATQDLSPDHSPGTLAAGWLAALPVAAAEAWDAIVLVRQAQHADAASLQVLASAVHQATERRILVVLELGEARIDNPLRQLHDELRVAAHQVLRIGPVTPEDVAEIAAQEGLPASAGLVRRLLDHCGADESEVVATLRLLAARRGTQAERLPVSGALRARMLTALTSLDDRARALLAACAVLEEARPLDRVDSSLAARMVQEPAPLGPLSELSAAGLLDIHGPDARWVGLPSAAQRQCVLDGVGLPEQTRLHELASRHHPDERARLRHRWLARPQPDDQLAARAEELATARAVRGEWLASFELWELAAQASAEDVVAGRRWVQAVDSLVAAGDLTQLEGRMARLEQVRETALREACLGYVGCLSGRPTTAGTRLERAWELCNQQREPQVARLVAERQVLHALARCRAEDVITWAGRAAEPAPDGVGEAGTSQEAEAVGCVALAAVKGPKPALRRLDELERVVPEGTIIQRILLARGWVQLAAGEHLLARDELERAVAADGWGGSFRIGLWASAWLARLHLETGRWEEAEQVARRGLDGASERGLALLVPLMQWTLAELAALRGDWAAADRAVRGGVADASHYEVMRVSAALARASVARARGNPEGVLEALTPLEQSWARGWVSAPGFWPWVELRGDALLTLGRRAEADDFLRPHEARAHRQRHAVQSARLGGLRARLELLGGEADKARALQAASLSELQRRPLPLCRARLHLGWAAALRRSGRRSEAEQEADLGNRLLATLGGWVGHGPTDDEMPGDGRPAAAPSLTAQELAVAELVASGRTNREVAGELFVSVKTVQYHLTRVYAKLGVRSRGELAARGVADVTVS